ncbi:PucR family transcriptional regulator [Nonomuraea glycinis]|uniref:PucR family transcriptional regulator n=1 Tax=Nonomuraea glycinis TaxID=2047744 RepID=UPI002E101891|nr:PucR family transcriptional regulator [Nonomuraea glycinis]
MAPSLRAVVRRMGLRPVAGGLDTVVRWVAVSELEDPAPFLEGDELLLTTGIRLGDDFSGYVARLVARGVAGLGFGVGLSHEEIPAALVAAAEQAGLPLLEVPRETPFIAIGKLVSELLAAEQYDEITRAFAAQGRLTRAALRPEGTHAVIDRLAKETGGWAILLDESGQVRHTTPGADADAVTAEITRLLTTGRTAWGAASGNRGSGRRFPASLALAGPDEHVVVQPLGGGSRPRGFFAVGAARPFSPVAHTVVNAAGSLLTLALEQGGAHLEAERRLRDAVLRLLLSGAPGAVEEARAVLGPLGARLPEEPFVVLAVGEEALEQVEAVAFAARLDPAGEAVPPADGPSGPLAGERQAGVAVLVAEGVGMEVAETVGVAVGVSSPCDYRTLRGGVEQACRAYGGSRGGVVFFGALAGQGLMALLEPAAARAFSAALLAPLVAYGTRADLMASLRAYLDSNGHWDAAAQRLGVHRHTLRYRMKRVTELLGCDLDDPGVRAELWFALEAARR